jgi:formylglycine-generating enzyme required for sulfatase activity
VYLDAFFMDIYEVTNAKYAQCVAEGPCTLPSKDYSNLRESYYNNPAYADYPVIWVDWNQANTYCDWVGKRLPTEAEFEKASRDNSTRMYPWGDQMPNCNLTNFQADAGHCVNDTTPVGSYPTGASPYGVLDIAGNVGEWTNDWYDSNYYSYSPYRNPTGPATGEMRVVRSGCWNGDWEILRSVNKASFTVVNNQNKLGFRCVLSP